ncbi:MAG: hypothetical protein KF773_36790 [Deltaproteobacteria bacterium]|nr:hypothetical protein [Deltaproteobacteria bacterium]MCW5804562.1 hypothetical protein [Deltaproteobacteria bacterium]
MRAPLAGIVVAAAIGICTHTHDAAAQPTAVACSFYEVEATSGKTPSVDSGIDALLAKRLQKGAFKQWNTFKLLSKLPKSLEKKKTEKLPLKQGGGQATLVEIVDKSQIRMTFAIDDGKGKTLASSTQTVDAGDWLIVVVEQPDKGHILAGTCK